ncbi:MAG: hypothetical protein JST31_15045 [Actinobacteria bacterium]|nr:hypothetical protein [Actinomycetota bacterium]
MLALLLAATPALPLGEAGKYVAGAYIVFVVLLLIYVGIMAAKLARIDRELREVANIAEERALAEDQAAPGSGPEGPSISDSLTPQGSRGGGA